MAEDKVGVPHFEKLSKHNYQLWKIQMETFLDVYGLRKIVNGSEAERAGCTVEEHDAWVKKDAKAKLAILTSIDCEQLDYISACENSAQMWTSLKTIYERKNSTSQLCALQDFHKYKFEGGSMASHIAKIDNLAKACKIQQYTIDDNTIMCKLLSDLPYDYDAIIDTWDTVGEDQKTVAGLKAKLLQREARLERRSQEVGSEALVVKKGSSTTKQLPDNKNNKCNRKCYFCKKVGHIARNCWLKKRGPKNENRHGADQSGVLLNIEEILNIRNEDTWIADSGASYHMSSRRDWFSYFEECSAVMSLADKSTMEVKGTGQINIEMYVNGRWETGHLQNVKFIPGLSRHLFSIGAATKQGVKTTIEDNQMNFYKNRKLVASALRGNNNLFNMLIRVKTVSANIVTDDVKLLHDRLGHVSMTTIRNTMRLGLLENVELPKDGDFVCEACIYGKSKRRSFKTAEEKPVYGPGEKFHSDVVGPTRHESIGGARWYVIFKDDATSFRYLFTMKNKNEVLAYFIKLVKLMKVQYNRVVKRLRSDNGLEYVNKDFKEFLSKNGIKHERSAPYTPEQNGSAERDHRTIAELAGAMLHGRHLPLSLWAEAVNTAVYILNRTATNQAVTSTPYELWTGKKPNFSSLRVFGSVAYEHVPTQKRVKFEPKATKKIFVGYEEDSSNYRLYDFNSNKITISANVTFDEAAEWCLRRDESKWPVIVYENEVDPSVQVQELREVREEETERVVTQHENQPRSLRDRSKIGRPQSFKPATAQSGLHHLDKRPRHFRRRC